MASALPVLFSVLRNSSIFINVNVSTCLYIWWAPCHLQPGTLTQILLFLPPETSGHSLSRFPPTKAKALTRKPPAVGPQSWMYLSLALLKMLWTKMFVFLSKSLFCSPRWAPTLPLQNINPLSHAITILSSGLQFLLDTQTRWNPQQPKSQLYSNILYNVIVQKQWLKLLLFRVGQWETISEGERAFSYDPPDLLFFPLFFFHHSPYDCSLHTNTFSIDAARHALAQEFSCDIIKAAQLLASFSKTYMSHKVALSFSPLPIWMNSVISLLI